MPYNPQDVSLLMAATHGFSDEKTTRDEKIAFLSTVLNRLESGREEFGVGGISPTSIRDVLYSDTSPYYEVQGENERFNNALEKRIAPYNEADYKRTAQIVSGVLRGTIERMPGEFIYRKSEVKKLKKNKAHDFDLTPEMGRADRFYLYGYE